MLVSLLAMLSAWGTAYALRKFWLGRVGFIAAGGLAMLLGLLAAAAQLAVVLSAPVVLGSPGSHAFLTLCISGYAAFTTLYNSDLEEKPADEASTSKR